MFAFIPLVSLVFLGSYASKPSETLLQQNNARLYSDLFTGYHRDLSPYNGHILGNNTDPATPVSISLQYARLIIVLEPEHQHRNMIGLFVEWQDPRLCWNASEYGGINHIYVNRFTVWMPEFYPCESSHASVVNSDQVLSIRINASGFLNTFVTYSAFFSCEFDVFRFPFDKQDCYYCFALHNYNHKDELRMKAKFTSHPYIYDTSEWSLKMHGIKHMEIINSDFEIGIVFYNISLIRKPQFWVGLVITPTFLIGTLIIIGLFFGYGVDIINNAVGLGLTTMMSMMAIVAILANALAKSAYIPLLGWYVLAEIVIIILAVLALLYSERLGNASPFLMNCACPESVPVGRLCDLRSKTVTTHNSVKHMTHKSLLRRGKQSNVWLFMFFIVAHVINIIILFNM